MDAEAIGRLTERYRALAPQERRRHNEAQTRKDFIDPLFASLGWDVRGVERNDVDVETHVSGGRVDYAFKIDGVVRFYLEAKKLEDDLYNPDYAKQVMTYAYNKGVPWAVLCNFARLEVFNAEWETDDLNRARFLDLAWQDYAEADSPLRLLSREAFLGGELDRRAQTYGGMRPRQPVEKSLYAQMRQWRERLFNEIARMRPDLSFEQVDEVIERLLNRLIFIRNCEDRRVEAADLRAALHQWQRPGRRAGLTEAVRAIFASFDATFDSDLFAFHLLDQLLAGGTQLEDTLGDIVAGLYAPPRSLAAYDFAVIDGDVLGQVYEQYLGHVAQVVKEVAAKRESQLALGIEVAQIELQAKRQRRKERGIYYTPKWVVDYIVRQTVGRYLEEHSYNDILNVKILDPACGSGSFLIRAFDVLLEHHARVRGKAAGELDQYERLPILTANVFGVDLDARAVDIARLSLLLRAVARRELLPSLERNIVRGNSLISGSEEELGPYFGEGWGEKQPFDWQREFPEIMAQGGFDIIVGNPPYVRIQTLDKQEVGYYNEHYQAATGNYDIYALFVEKGLELLRPGGVLGFIIPNKFMQAEYGKGLRRLLSEERAVSKIVDFGDAQVFESGTNYTCLLFLQKAPVGEAACVLAAQKVKERPQAPNLAGAGELATHVDAALLGERPWGFAFVPRGGLLEKLSGAGPALQDVADLFVGLQTSADKIYIVERRGTVDDGSLSVLCRANGRTYEVEPDLFHPLLKGSLHMRRYHFDPTKLLVLFPYHEHDGRYELIPQSLLEQRWPLVWRYLLDNRQVLEEREGGKMRHGRWYAYVYPKNLGCFDKPKLLTPSIARRASFSYDARGEYYFVGSGGGGGGGYGITLKPDVEASPLYVLGLLNSKALDYYLHTISSCFRGGYWAYNRQYIAQLPIRLPGMGDPTDKGLHDSLAALVGRMLALHERLAGRGDMRDEERGQIEREIERTDREIDELVYDLYGLTQEERRLVEQGMGR
jgi:type I restriction-modification system DNA methylase subunit